MANYRVKIGVVVTKLLVIATIIAAASAAPAWAGKGLGSGMAPLSEEEISTLEYMREEEKLARDVYVVMYDDWGAYIFTRIAASEQQHMDTMLKMLLKHNLTDSAHPSPGVFFNGSLQELYDQLVAQGRVSFVQGLLVGCVIEEQDIVDIQDAINETTHIDLRTAYEHLLEGSKSHLRAFVSDLEKQGVTYESELLSQELFDAIMGL